MAEHASAPWSRDEYGHIIDAKGASVALFGLHVSMATGSDRNSDYMQQARANTDLFFAAPEMLAMLKRVMWTIEDASLYGEVVALIDKAEGKEA